MPTVELRLVYLKMWEAAKKAEAASERYRSREAELNAKIEAELDRDGIRGKWLRKLRIDEHNKDDHWLNKYMRQYKFFRGEQIRLGQLLLAHQAYTALKGDFNGSEREVSIRNS